MNICSKYGEVGQALSKKIEEIKQEKNEDYSTFKMECIQFEERLAVEKIEPPCLDCDDCMTFVENRRIVYGYLFEGKDKQWVIEQEQYVKRQGALIKSLDTLIQFM
ncbi:hypothetical protein G5716_29830 [Bacillus pacificus]|nr:hypothetical protein [Bacillus pacificus]